MRTLAQFFKTLADESRLQILWLLSKHEELCVCDVVEALCITQSKASRHLTTLKHAGLVADRRDGAWSYYSLKPVANALERAQLQSLLTGMECHPGAAEVLRDLNAWLATSSRGKTCADKRGCKPAHKREPKRP